MTADCPYCEKEVNINHDDGYGYEEDRLYEQECYHCGKMFVYNTTVSFYHDAHKADCLNGEEHDFKRTRTYPPEFAVMRCTMCGVEKPLNSTDHE